MQDHFFVYALYTSRQIPQQRLWWQKKNCSEMILKWLIFHKVRKKNALIHLTFHLIVLTFSLVYDQNRARISWWKESPLFLFHILWFVYKNSCGSIEVIIKRLLVTVDNVNWRNRSRNQNLDITYRYVLKSLWTITVLMK